MFLNWCLNNFTTLHNEVNLTAIETDMVRKLEGIAPPGEFFVAEYSPTGAS
jgi:hypothetical protein